MKKVITAVLILMGLCCSICFAESEPFDYKVLSDFENYSYDKFEKKWTYHGAYVKEYADATVVIGVETAGDTSGVDAVMFYAWIRDEYNKDTLYVVKELMILADDTLITCTLMDNDTSSATVVTPVSVEALRMISEAKELAFKLSFSTGSITLEPSPEDIAEFVEAARVIYQYDLVSHVTDTSIFEIVERLFPITIE
ncbi:MAG: hypothetical protein IJE07_14475 [Clostridia bacterium]|nr:hypothetical protein [Clostridia bacterium]